MALDPAHLRGMLERLDIADVRELFGGTWRIFHAAGWWCAFRRGGGMISHNGPASLIQPCVRAERLADLAAQLCLQEFFSALSDAELARVYAAGEIPEDLFDAPAC